MVKNALQYYIIYKEMLQYNIDVPDILGTIIIN